MVPATAPAGEIHSNSNLNWHFEWWRERVVVHVSVCTHIYVSVNPRLFVLCVWIYLLDCIHFRDSRRSPRHRRECAPLRPSISRLITSSVKSLNWLLWQEASNKAITHSRPQSAAFNFISKTDSSHFQYLYKHRNSAGKQQELSLDELFCSSSVPHRDTFRKKL